MNKSTVSAVCLTLALMAPLPAAADAAKPASRAAGAVDQRALDLFSDVFERVRGQYVEKVTDEQLVTAAITGMLTSLDPHSSFLDTEDFADLQVQTRGEFGGLGIEVTQENGLVKVISPIDDTPAARAGLQAGDLITQLDGEPVMGLTLRQAVDKMRGPAGQEIKIMVRRGGAEAEPIEVSLVREVIRTQPVKFRTEANVGYIRITGFSQQTQPGLEKAVHSIEGELGNRLIGYVLDLRNNPGGLLDQAVSVADSFLDNGSIVSTRIRGGVETQRFDAKPGDLVHGAPIVVLINGGSASASEIVAGALQDHHRALLLGTQSFGKGSVQTIMPLTDRKAMKLTTARYYTPSGRSIQATGIAPDIEVQPARLEVVAQAGGRKEADLRGALKNDTHVNAGAAQGQPKTGGPVPTDGKDDYQFQRAVDLLVGSSLFRQKQPGTSAQPTVTRTSG
jgi:carboxyl-terminal processing protease